MKYYSCSHLYQKTCFVALWPCFPSAGQSLEGGQTAVIVVSVLVQAFIAAFETGELRTEGDLLLSSGTFYFTAFRRDDDY